MTQLPARYSSEKSCFNTTSNSPESQVLKHVRHASIPSARRQNMEFAAILTTTTPPPTSSHLAFYRCFLTCIFPILTHSTIDLLLPPPPPPLLPMPVPIPNPLPPPSPPTPSTAGPPQTPEEDEGPPPLPPLALAAAAAAAAAAADGGECVASISRIRMAWLRLLRSFRPVVAVRRDLVPRATRAATAAAELTGTRSPLPPDKNTPREGCSRISILVDGGGGGGGVGMLPASDECREFLLCGVLLCLPVPALLLLLVPEALPATPSKRLWKTLLYISTYLWF